MLVWSLGHRAAMIGVAGVVVLSAAFLYPYVGKELVPDDDQGEFSINVRLPRGTSYPRTEEFIAPIEKDVLALPALQRVMQNVNSGFASFNITMLPLEERKISQQQLMIQARQMLRKYQGARISVSGGTDISGASTGGGRGPGGGGGGCFNRLNILIQGPDIEQLQAYTVQLMDLVRTIHRHASSMSTRTSRPTQPELRIKHRSGRAAARASASTSTRWPPTCAPWWAVKRSRSSRTATISSSCCCGSTSRFRDDPPGWATCWWRRRRTQGGQGQ